MSGFPVTLALAMAAALAGPQVKQVAEQAKQGKAVIVDVREADELADGMVSSAYWLSTSDIKDHSPRYQEILKRLPKDTVVYTYCAAGHRAGRFADELRQAGFKAENLGGYKDLEKAGFPVKPVKDAKSQPCPYLCGPQAK